MVIFPVAKIHHLKRGKQSDKHAMYSSQQTIPALPMTGTKFRAAQTYLFIDASGGDEMEREDPKVGRREPPVARFRIHSSASGTDKPRKNAAASVV